MQISRMKPWRILFFSFTRARARDRSLGWPRTSLALHFCHAPIERVNSSRKWNAIKEPWEPERESWQSSAKTEERERGTLIGLTWEKERDREERQRERERNVRSYRSESRGLEIIFLAATRAERYALNPNFLLDYTRASNWRWCEYIVIVLMKI